MYNKIVRLVTICMCIFFSLGTLIYAQDYSLNDLIEKGKELNGKEVVVRGEAIGEELNRNNYSWVNINDKTNAMGIYMKVEDSKAIVNYGGFNKIGDNIEVKGIFNRACSEHGGDMDIHATQVKIVEKGRKIDDNVPKYKILLCAVLSVVTGIVALILYKIIKNK